MRIPRARGNERPGPGAGEKGLVSSSKRRMRSGPRICRTPSRPQRNNKGMDSFYSPLLHHVPLSSHHSLGGSSHLAQRFTSWCPSFAVSSPGNALPLLSVQQPPSLSSKTCHQLTTPYLLHTSSFWAPATLGTFTHLFINSLVQQAQIST